jgi:hypothetical protein
LTGTSDTEDANFRANDNEYRPVNATSRRLEQNLPKVAVNKVFSLFDTSNPNWIRPQALNGRIKCTPPAQCTGP